MQSSTRADPFAEIIDEHDTGIVLIKLGVEHVAPIGGNGHARGEVLVRLHHIGLLFAVHDSISGIFTVDETDTVASDANPTKVCSI